VDDSGQAGPHYTPGSSGPLKNAIQMTGVKLGAEMHDWPNGDSQGGNPMRDGGPEGKPESAAPPSSRPRGFGFPS
jgi:hypothetical protein